MPPSSPSILADSLSQSQAFLPPAVANSLPDSVQDESKSSLESNKLILPDNTQVPGQSASDKSQRSVTVPQVFLFLECSSSVP
jgi:hypothetical protein